MSTQDVYALSDRATAAQAKIQKDFKDIDPVIGIRSNMRASGFPADAMTIDSLSSGKRITFIVHDEQPGNVAYQFGHKDKDPSADFTNTPFDEVTTDKIYHWIKEHLSA